MDISDLTVRNQPRKPGTPLPKWKRRPEARPREILDAALRVFAARGYGTTRLEDVAAAAGVTKGTIYYYFENKEDLLAQELHADSPKAFVRAVQGSLDALGPFDKDRMVDSTIELFLHSLRPTVSARAVVGKRRVRYS